MNVSWDQLPGTVQLGVNAITGAAVTGFEPATAGRHSPLSGTVRLADGARMFCKGIPLDNAHLWMHRNEAAINHHLPRDLAPKLVGRVERDGWLVLVFEHALGRHANLAPGSADLPLIAAAVSGLSVLNPDPAGVQRSMVEHWSSLRAWHCLAETPHMLHPADIPRLPAFLDWEQRALPTLAGDSLAHTDLHALNILVAPDRAWIVDWAWARRAPIWIDPTLLVLRLIDQGHTPAQAEQWASQIPGWTTATDDELTGFAVATLGVWEHLRVARPLPMRERLSDAARRWVNHRLSSVQVGP